MIAKFVPKIDNWSICDSFCCGLKWAKKNQEEMWYFIETYFDSQEAFELRFSIVMMLDFFINEVYIDKVLHQLAQINSQDYYVQMASAWAVSVCYVKFPYLTELLLRAQKLHPEIQRLAIRKIIESYRVTPLQKETLKKYDAIL